MRKESIVRCWLPAAALSLALMDGAEVPEALARGVAAGSANALTVSAASLDPAMGARRDREMQYQQREHAFAMEADDDVVVVDRYGAKMFTLNKVGGLLWEHAAQPRTTDDMVDFLRERHGVDAINLLGVCRSAST